MNDYLIICVGTLLFPLWIGWLGFVSENKRLRKRMALLDFRDAFLGVTLPVWLLVLIHFLMSYWE